MQQQAPAAMSPPLVSFAGANLCMAAPVVPAAELYAGAAQDAGQCR